MKPTTWLLIGAVAVLAWLAFRDKDPEPSRVALDYNQLAVSEGLTAEAQELNLADDLDVALLPDIGRQAIRDAAQQGLKEQAFLQAVLRDVSNRVREVSTIDLNADGITDPVIVKPEPQAGEQFVLLSLQVPAPDAYPLPEAREQEAWQKVETIEVATMSVALNEQALTVQAQGNPHVYPGAAQQPHSVFDSVPSFMTMYFAMRMMDWMFMPAMYGGWGPGYGGYQQPPVGDQAARRQGTLASRNYERAAPRNDSAIRTRGGAAPTSQYSRLYANQRPQALNQLRSSTAFRARQSAAAPAAGGFGKPTAQSRSPGAFSNRLGEPSRSVTSPRPFRPRIGSGFGGGFGRSGIRFRRCHGCWRGPVTQAALQPGVFAVWQGPVSTTAH